MACSTKTLKIFAVFWDVIVALLALSNITLGLYVILKFKSFYIASFIAITVGSVLLVTALFGVISAWRESSVLCRTFVGVLIFLVVLEFLLLAFLWFFQSAFIIDVNNAFDHLWGTPQIPIPPHQPNRIANLEKWFECCGNVGPTDYSLPPYSCYIDNTRLKLRGCRQTILDFVSESWLAFNIFMIVLVLVELICALLAYVLANSIVNRWRRSKYYPK